ncbi:MAG: hypothetical protein RIT81_17245 [Deltaproteobacteria bacterium]
MGVALFVLLAAAAADDADRPYVEILESTGAVDGPAESGVGVPTWERVRMELRVENRLQVDVTGLELDIALVSAAKDDAPNVIPGWSFREELTDTIVDALDTAYVRITHQLPARRTSPPADEIAYRVRIISYRMSEPDLGTALGMLGSSRAADQRAALRSYGADFEPTARARHAEELAIAIGTMPAKPAASDALRLLFAVRALGALGARRHVADLLYLPERLEREVWGRAVLDLAERMIDASEKDEPRLSVLPSWARNKSDFLTVRAEDALEDAVREAILRMGDAAVPALLLSSLQAPESPVRSRAKRLLHALGRSTVRSQLTLRDRDSRLAVIQVLGRSSSSEPVPALVELARGRDKALAKAARAALLSIGPDAVEGIVEALGAPGDEDIVDTLVQIGRQHPKAILEIVRRYGVTIERSEVEHVVERLHAHLRDARRARLRAEVELALDAGREGRYAECFAQLDRVFAQDEALYMSYAEPIAEQYLARAERLLARGDYDAAVDTLRAGLTVQDSEKARALLSRARIALVRGYVELGELSRAQEVLAQVEERTDERRTAEGLLLAASAKEAVRRGELSRARQLLDRARAIDPDDPALTLVDRRLMLSENISVVIVLGLLIPAAILALVLWVRKRLESARMRRLERQIDRG